LLGATAQAGMYEDFADCRVYMRTLLDVSGTTLSDSTANMFLRDAAHSVNFELAAKKALLTDTLVRKKGTYKLDSFAVIVSVDIKFNDTIKSLLYVPREKWSSQTHQSTFGAKGFLRFPSYFDWNDSLIFIAPAPFSSGDSIFFVGIRRLPISDSGGSLSYLSLEYRIAVVKYAAFLAARAKQHPMAGSFLQDYKEYVARFLPAKGVSNETP
jgi:hypothetical protein